MIRNAQHITSESKTYLLTIVQKYVQMTKRGLAYESCCPFHDEKSPSFKVTPSKEVYKCFGCGVGGNNGVSFIMDKEGVTYPEALVTAAQILGIVVEYDKSGNFKEYVEEQRTARDHKTKLFTVIKEVAQLYAPDLSLAGKELAGKIYTTDMIQKYGICIAPDAALHTSSIDQTALVELGLIKPSKQGSKYYDTFYKRLLFPIAVGPDRIAGYTARTLDIDGKPKYLNSSDSAIYKKEKILYGLYPNSKHIDKAGYAIDVEGTTDVIALDMAGLPLGVAACGTAHTVAQAKLLARSADRVIIMADGDAAGLKSIKQKILNYLAANIEPRVLLLPEGDDPATWLPKQIDASAMIADSNICGIAYLVQIDLGDKTARSTSAALDTAAELIAKIDDEYVRRSYIQTIAKDILEIPVKDLKTAVNEIITVEETLEDRLTDKQKQQRAAFEVYEDRNRYYSHTGARLSNFVIRPKFLIYSGDGSQRVFEIINDQRDSVLICIESDDMTSLGTFKKKTEGEGNFVFKGNDSHYTCVRQLIYTDVDRAYPIHTLGYHKNGFYAWANGVTLPDGAWLPIDDYGIVRVSVGSGTDKREVMYYLPEHSIKKTTTETDESDQDELLQHFIYVDDPKCPQTFSQWAVKYKEVMGDRGILGLCFYMATIYRSYIFKHHDFFPLFNMFGEAGSGKTYLSELLAMMFGKKLKATNAVTTTKASFFRKGAQSRDALANYEEYSEKVPDVFVEGFKSFYNGFGRDLATMSKSHQTKKVPVHNSIAVMGQILPTHDPALLERMITEFFVKIKLSEEAKTNAMKFAQTGDRGGWSRYTAELFALRQTVIDEYEDANKYCKTVIIRATPKPDMPGTRVLENFGIMVTIYKIISEKIALPWTLNEVMERCIERMIDQSKSVESAQELSDWWRILFFLIDDYTKRSTNTHYTFNGGITERDYDVVMKSKLSVYNKKTKESVTKDLGQPTKILFIRVKQCYNLYRVEGKRSDIDRVLDEKTLVHYLTNSKAFIGNVKSHRFEKKTNTSAMAFDLSAISGGEDLEILNYQEQPMPSAPTPSDEGMTPHTGDQAFF